jgi:hypothetical protein
MLSAVLMKILYALLVVSVSAIVIAIAATLWRLRWHLRRPAQRSQHSMGELHPDHEPAEKVR